MGYIDSNLQPGEQVLLRIRRGRKWYHVLLLILGYLVLVPLTFLIIWNVLLPYLMAVLPARIALLIVLGSLGLITIALFFDFIHFLVDEIALTDRRVFGRAQGLSAWLFPIVDLPLSLIDSVNPGMKINCFDIRLKDGKRPVTIANLSGINEFVTKLEELLKK